MTKRLVLASLMLVTTHAVADSLDDDKYWQEQMDHWMTKSLEDAEKECDVKFSFDWVAKPTFRAGAEKEKNTPYAICNNIVQRTIQVCRGGDHDKAAVKAKLKGFRCGHATSRKLELKKGIVTYMGNNVQSNFDEWAKAWLRKNL